MIYTGVYAPMTVQNVVISVMTTKPATGFPLTLVSHVGLAHDFRRLADVTNVPNAADLPEFFPVLSQ